MSNLPASAAAHLAHADTAWAEMGSFDPLEAALAACGAGEALAAEQHHDTLRCELAVAVLADDLAALWSEPIAVCASESAEFESVCVCDFSATLSPALIAGEVALNLDAVSSAFVTAAEVAGEVTFAASREPGGTLTVGASDSYEDTDDDVPSLPRLTLRRFAISVGAVLGLGAVTAVAIAPATDLASPPVRLVVDQVSLGTPPQGLEEIAPPALRISQSEVVNRGETVSSLLARLGANDPELAQFITTDRVAKRLMQLQPGRTVRAELDEVGVVHRLQYRHGNLEIDGRAPLRITIAREGGWLVATEAPVAIDRGIEARTAEIRSTLFAATDAAGIPDSVATRAADILSNGVDLRKDLRRGAQLRVVYETLREADSLDLPVPGRVLALELESGSLRHEAVWFEHDDGKGAYYNFSGQSLIRSFLREPIQYTRITSGFSGARLHPLFRDVRAHTGTDFAAPVGTKVRSVADGVVDFAGYNGGYGRTVIVSHPGKITTLYAHLNTFGDGVTKGARVTQGQVIGTVGMTGWTTGPHLHYEFRVAGRHVDPLRAVLPEGRKLSMSERMRFMPLAESYREHMAQMGSVANTAQAKFE
jgi:murein DD-endopeptidase MepM/ murein hydrolase activator NlpD